LPGKLGIFRVDKKGSLVFAEMYAQAGESVLERIVVFLEDPQVL
jgi:hypothetical protein